MKYSLCKRIWSMVLAICLVLTLFPTFVSHVELEANALSVNSLTCANYISNSMARSYIDTMMKYYITSNSTLQSTLNSGKCVIFMFEGGSDNYWEGSDYYNALSDVRIQAAVFVVKLDSSGNAYIDFCSETCSSIPSYAPDCSAGVAHYGSTTILDGVYRAYRWDHTGPYAAFQLDINNSNANGNGLYVPSSVPNGQLMGCSGINIHTRSTTSYSNWSAGCQLIGSGNSSSNEFNAFFKSVTGFNFSPWISWSPKNLYTYGSYGYSYGSGYTVGYYVVDRQLGMIGADGTKYGDGSLNEIYNTTALGKLTSYSTAAAEAAGALDFEYATSSCTYYPAHCQITINSDTPINTQPRSVSTADNSVNLGTATVGKTYTATGLYLNGFGNYWYRVETDYGETSYLYAGDTTYIKQLTSDITLTDYDVPNGHPKGGTFYVTGTIQSQHNKLDTATCYIYSGFDESDESVTGYSDSVSSNKYVLDDSTIDYYTWFGTLETGNYTYEISTTYTNYYATSNTTVESNSGTITLLHEYFVVTPSSVDQSSCSHTLTTKTLGDAGCTSTKTIIESCSTCGYLTKTIATGSHSYGAWTTTQAAGCTTEGIQKRTCSVCGESETKSIAAVGHNYSSKTFDATCVEYARTEYTCSNCGDNYSVYHNDLDNWLENRPDGVADSELDTKTQYRYSDYETTTSYSTALDGYTQLSKAWEKSGTSTVMYVASWPSGFDTGNSVYTKYNNTKVTASETATDKYTVESDELCGYIFYHWCYGTYTAGPINRTTSPTNDGKHNTFHAYYADKSAGDPANMTTAPDTSVVNGNAACCTDSHWFYHIPVYKQTYTTYKALYTYERWTDYSEWSDTAVSASDTRKVETRTVYRLRSTGLGDHNWDNGVISTSPTCTSSGVRTYTCTVCGETKKETIGISGHNYHSVVTAPSCNAQGYTTHTCTNCGGSYVDSYVAATGHNYSKVVTPPTCTAQGYTTHTCSNCSSSYVDTYVKAAGHSWLEGVCSDCEEVCEHAVYDNRVCTVCGQAEPVKDYYLFGYINGEDYACESDYSNLGEYKFVDGKLVVTFQCDSYVAVKSADNINWYMTKGYLGEVTSATLYNTNSGIANADKLFVPGNVEITFTLVINEDDTLTLSYDYAPLPTIMPSHATLALEGEVKYNIFFTVSDISTIKEMGLITFTSKPEDGTMDNAEYIVPGAATQDGYYRVQSQGIPAKMLGDALYMKVYAQLENGTYIYSALMNYSAKKYANNMMTKYPDRMDLINLLVAMLNYGAEAQKYFNYRTDDLINAHLTAQQQATQVTYADSLLAARVSAATSKTKYFVRSDKFDALSATMVLEGAFAINYHLDPSLTPENGMKLYYWSEDTYNSVDVLTLSNADGYVEMKLEGTSYSGVYEGLAAKEIDDTVYAVGIYESDGMQYTTGVMSYSLAQYCKNAVKKNESTADLAKATTIYSYYAKILFNET